MLEPADPSLNVEYDGQNNTFDYVYIQVQDLQFRA